MKKRKEFIKSLFLIFLIITSLFLTLIIYGYKPDYEILGARFDKKKAHQDYYKLHNNSLSLLSPYIITKKNTASREEKAIENSIVKINTEYGVKDISVIKNILSKISEAKVTETRIRNRDIKNIIVESNNYYNFRYRNELDTLSAKNIYLSDNNQTVSFNFDEVLISDSKRNILFLYKKGSENYLQVEFETDIYAEIDKIFEVTHNKYSHYVVDSRKDIYVRDDVEDYYIDTYKFVENNLTDVAVNIFLDVNNIKFSDKDSIKKEITDGYSMLRLSDKVITYINPSNIINIKNNINNSIIQERANTFLISGYIPKIDYTPINIQGNSIIYQEIYKDGLAFSQNKEDISNIKVKVSIEGVYEVEYPNKIRDTQISSEHGQVFLVDNILEILNYLYSNVKLQYIDDIELGYEKIYKDYTVKYVPTWYIKYNGKYIKYADLKYKIKKGEI